MEFNEEEIKEMQEEILKECEKKYGIAFKKSLMKIIALERMIPKTVASISRIIPLVKWNDYHDYPTVSALRQYYFYREENGFSACVSNGGNNGGRILLKESEVFKWIENKKKVKKTVCQ